MVSEVELLEKLEHCIQCVGEEWSEQSDARFISERSQQTELLRLLWQEEQLWVWVTIQEGRPELQLPIAYAEWYAVNGKKYDVALLDKTTIEEWVLRIRYVYPGYSEEAARLPVLAAVELKSQGHPQLWTKLLARDLDKLVRGLAAKQVRYGYFVVFYDARKYPLPAEAIRAYVAGRRKELDAAKRDNLKIYLAACGDPSVQSEWV